MTPERREGARGRRNDDEYPPDDVSLARRVHDLKGQVHALVGHVELLTEGLAELVTSAELEARLEALEEQVATKVEKRLATLERQTKAKVRGQGRRLALGLIGGLVLLALLGYGFIYSQRLATAKVRTESRQRAIGACEARNRTNQVLRDVVDRSQSVQNIDPSKLSPETRRILAEFAAAQPTQDDPGSFRGFVYATTSLEDCGKLPRP